MATDQAFYRLLDAQSLLDVAKATVAARGNVQNLISALTKSALKSDLDLNIASADLSQAQLLQLDTEDEVASASAALAAVLAVPIDTVYRAVEDPETLPPRPHRRIVLQPSMRAHRCNAPTSRPFASTLPPTRSLPARRNGNTYRPSLLWRAESPRLLLMASSFPTGTQLEE